MTAQSDPTQATVMALGRIPSGLFVLTARQGDRETGMLVSWVQQCGFEPLQISVVVRRDRELLAWLTQGAAFTLNQLAEGQSALLSHFGKGFAIDQPAFTGLKVDRPAGEAPVLLDALAHLHCRVAGRLNAGDHELLIGTVVAGHVLQPDGKPMVHIRKNGLRY